MAYTAEGFLSIIKNDVIEDMKASRILASLTAAQALIESNKGNSGLTQKANNLFGIKANKAWKGEYVTMPTKEFVNGKYITVDAKFRKYSSWEASINDHSKFLTDNKRYSNLIGVRDYKLACKLIKDDGYATSPTYTKTLIDTIEKYKLYLWDTCNQFATNLQPDKQDLPTLRRGDKNAYVWAWQNYLTLCLMYSGNIDGIFGEKTEEAVKKWQSANGLKADGIIGQKSWAKLGL